MTSRFLKKNDYIGGHTHPIDVDAGGKTYPVDTGFIVFNEATDPNFVEFFHNHGFLNVCDQPQCLVVRGGARRYVEKLIQPFADRIRLNCAVASMPTPPSCRASYDVSGGGENAP